MNRTRLFFISMLGLAAIGVAVAAFINYGDTLMGQASPNLRAAVQSAGAPPAPAGPPATLPAVTLVTQSTPAASGSAATVGTSTAQSVTSSAEGAHLAPMWGPNYKADDGLGRLVCASYAFSADYPLQQIQMQGLDVKRGFHLGIVPFYLNDNYAVSANERLQAMRDGKIDCLLATFDQFALEDPGTITAFINESAGGDQLWSRGLTTLNDLKGKRIAFEANGPSEFFVLDLLNTVKIAPGDVTMVPTTDQGAAIKAFNEGQADAVAGWTPLINQAAQGGGKVLATSRDFRSIMGTIIMSPEAMRSKKTAIQLFHDAWFEALSRWETDIGGSAQAIAAWGHNDYLGVKTDTAEADMRGLLGGVAQANLTDNVRAMTKVSAVMERLLKTRQLWAANGHTVPSNDVTKLIDAQFVQATAAGAQLDLLAPNKFVNNTFSLGRDQVVASSAPAPAVAQGATTAAPAAQADTSTPATTSAPNGPNAGSATVAQPAASNAVAIATLPCKRFEFIPNSTNLQPESQQELRDCALDVLKQNLTLFVRVKGSSAWPGPKGAVQQQTVETTARARAQSIVDYLVAQGINRERFVVEWIMPPEDHWETTDVTKQAKDRFVEITLLSSGL